jgi:beta-N-acetylhexosaminidase
MLILIDQEGGRVQRLGPPHWRALPPAAAYLRAYGDDLERACCAARLVARLTAAELRGVGINTNCAPLLDVPVPGSHAIIGERAYARSPDAVARLGAAVADGLCAGGVLPVIKHIPGHGRATSDSHVALPIVTTPRDELEGSDFLPFRALAALPAAMTAHVVFTAFDAGAPASTSPQVIAEAIRGAIGFDGLLLSDDLAMQALSGGIGARARGARRRLRPGARLQRRAGGDRRGGRRGAAPVRRGASALRAGTCRIWATGAFRHRRGRGAPRRGLPAGR